MVIVDVSHGGVVCTGKYFLKKNVKIDHCSKFSNLSNWKEEA